MDATSWFLSWNGRRGLIGRGTGYPVRIDCCYDVGVSRVVIHVVIDAGRTWNRDQVDTFAPREYGILRYCILSFFLLFASIHAIADGIVLSVRRGRTGLPRESHFVGARGMVWRLYRRNVCRWADRESRRGRWG